MKNLYRACIVFGCAFLLLFTVKADDAHVSAEAGDSVVVVEAEQVGTPEFKKPFTVSASLREEFDDNIYTTRTNKRSQFKTIVEPSILFSFPLEQTSFSFRYTPTLVYYPDRDGRDYDLNHEFVGRVTHSFSSRLNLDLREQFRYSNEPAIFDSAALVRRSGEYIYNVASIQGDIQWTPKFGTTSAYTNTYTDYIDDLLSETNDRMSHNFDQDFRYLILPTTTLVFAGGYFYNDYENVSRDSQAITASVGVDHSFSPQFTGGIRLGGQYVDLLQGGGDNIAPYGSLFANYQLGARSSIEFNYSHSFQPTDATNFYGQEADVITLAGRYQFTPKFSTKLQAIYTHGNYVSEYTLMGESFQEDVLAFDLGFNFKLNNYLDLEAGYTFTSVMSDFAVREYDRNRVYIGIRGTY
jgi:hypothetical protein